MILFFLILALVAPWLTDAALMSLREAKYAREKFFPLTINALYNHLSIGRPDLQAKLLLMKANFYAAFVALDATSSTASFDQFYANVLKEAEEFERQANVNYETMSKHIPVLLAAHVSFLMIDITINREFDNRFMRFDTMADILKCFEQEADQVLDAFNRHLPFLPTGQCKLPKLLHAFENRIFSLYITLPSVYSVLPGKASFAVMFDHLLRFDRKVTQLADKLSFYDRDNVKKEQTVELSSFIVAKSRIKDTKSMKEKLPLELIRIFEKTPCSFERLIQVLQTVNSNDQLVESLFKDVHDPSMHARLVDEMHINKLAIIDRTGSEDVDGFLNRRVMKQLLGFPMEWNIFQCRPDRSIVTVEERVTVYTRHPNCTICTLSDVFIDAILQLYADDPYEALYQVHEFLILKLDFILYHHRVVKNLPDPEYRLYTALETFCTTIDKTSSLKKRLLCQDLVWFFTSEAKDCPVVDSYSELERMVIGAIMDPQNNMDQVIRASSIHTRWHSPYGGNFIKLVPFMLDRFFFNDRN